LFYFSYKIECTWDETPRDRINITRSKYTNLKDIDAVSYKNLLASSSSSSSDTDGESEPESENHDLKQNDSEEAEIHRYKKLLKLDAINESDDDLLQITWDNDLNSKGFVSFLRDFGIFKIKFVNSLQPNPVRNQPKQTKQNLMIKKKQVEKKNPIS
jgi:hypothetical protein